MTTCALTSKGGLMTSLFQYMDVRYILPTYVFSYMVDLPDGVRYQVNEDTYVRLISNPNNKNRCIGNILILQGGIKHMNSKTYYVRTASILMASYNVRIFVFEKLLPVANPNFGHDVAKALKYIKRNFGGRIAVIGYSMGGVLLFNYLSKGYDHADFYVPTCCTLNMKNFNQTLSAHAIFDSLHKNTIISCGASSQEDLLRLSGCTPKDYQKFADTLIPRLKATQKHWKDKLIYVISSLDPLTQDYQQCIDQFDTPPFVYIVQGGWHCCLDSIYLSAKLACNYLLQRDKGIRPKLDEIPTN